MLGEWGRSEWATVSGSPVHAVTDGPSGGPGVVLVHGLGVSHRYFRPLALDLARDFAVAAPDLPGFGRTPGPSRALDVRGLSTVLAAWLRRTGRTGWLLVANSAGCQVVADLARHAPDVLGPTVLIGPTFDRAHRTLPAQALRLAVASAKESASLVPVLAQDYVACGPRRFLASLRLYLRDRIEDKVGAMGVPVVVMRGQYDAIAPERWVAELVARLPAGRVVEVPDAGHALNWTAPGPVAEVVRELAGVTPCSPGRR